MGKYIKVRVADVAEGQAESREGHGIMLQFNHMCSARLA